jgi:hypothetical protein
MVWFQYPKMKLSRVKRTGLLFIVCLAGLSMGFAQSLPQIPLPQIQGNSWFGFKTGYINSSYPFGFSVHFGVKNPNSLDLRVSGSLQRRSEATALGFGVDTLRSFTDSFPLSVYGGAGGQIFFEGSSFLFDIHGLIGTEYRLAEADLEELGIFFEIHIGAALATGDIPQPGIPVASVLFGVNIYF